jgi:16S rRNA pseudouridine516 synthase
MRLDQFVSQAVNLPRSLTQIAIRQGRVQVQGQIVVKPQLHITEDADVQLDSVSIRLAGLLYIMLHKPVGVVSATEDPTHRTVLSLVNHSHQHTLHLVGRLDKDTTGLMLLTNDGNWSHKITAPRSHVPKTYLATLAEPLNPAAATQLRQGVQLHGEKGLSAATNVEILANGQVRLSIHEGKYHQVKRMLAAVNNRVTALHREQIGGLSLDAQLPHGAWRELTSAEVECVLRV